jgi:hypothetical protein
MPTMKTQFVTVKDFESGHQVCINRKSIVLVEPCLMYVHGAHETKMQPRIRIRCSNKITVIADCEPTLENMQSILQ